MASRLLDGFAGRSGAGAYRDVKPSPASLTTERAHPVPGTNLKQDNVIVFEWTLLSNQLARFKPDAVELAVRIRYRKDENADWEHLDANTLETTVKRPNRHPFYLNPLLAGQSFFSKFEVLLDGQFVSNSSLGHYPLWFSGTERIFTTGDAFARKYGRQLHRISNTGQYRLRPEGGGDTSGFISVAAAARQGRAADPQLEVPPADDAADATATTAAPASTTTTTTTTTAASGAPPAKAPKVSGAGLQVQGETVQSILDRVAEVVNASVGPRRLPEPLHSVTRELRSDEKDDAIMLRFTIPYFPFTMQTSVMENLGMARASNPYIHPGSRICVRLYKMDPLDAAVERYDVTTKLSDSYGTALQPNGQLDVEIVDMTIAYESLMLKEEDDMADVRTKTHTFLPDSALMEQKYLRSNTAFDTHSFTVYPGTKAFIACMTQEDHVLGTMGRKISTRSTFVPGLTEMRFRLQTKSGVTELLHLTDPGVAAGHFSTSVRDYHASLVRRGIYDQSFDTFFPRDFAASRGLEQAVVIDLIPYDVREPCSILLNLTYAKTNAPPKWMIIAFNLIQRQVKFNWRTSEWTVATLN